MSAKKVENYYSNNSKYNGNVNSVNANGDANTPPKRNHLEIRALRRHLASIEPSNSHPQLQSPLFATLPSEVRNLIFEHAVHQRIDSALSPRETQPARLRPSHDLKPLMDTALLLTCRRIYYETHAIALRSATHHVYGEQATSYDAADWDHYLHHVSAQQGAHLHHLHVTCWKIPNFAEFLAEHLHWRKITWTMCAHDWVPLVAVDVDVDVDIDANGDGDDNDNNANNANDEDETSEKPDSFGYLIASALRTVTFPASAREITLEFEVLETMVPLLQRLRSDLRILRSLSLTRSDGTSLQLDADLSLEYAWQGETWAPGDWATGRPGEYVEATYRLLRLCWRDGTPRRKYMHYDYWDCLRSGRMRVVGETKGIGEREGVVNTVV